MFFSSFFSSNVFSLTGPLRTVTDQVLSVFNQNGSVGRRNCPHLEHESSEGDELLVAVAGGAALAGVSFPQRGIQLAQQMRRGGPADCAMVKVTDLELVLPTLSAALMAEVFDPGGRVVSGLMTVPFVRPPPAKNNADMEIHFKTPADIGIPSFE